MGDGFSVVITEVALLIYKGDKLGYNCIGFEDTSQDLQLEPFQVVAHFEISQKFPG